jgi:hypothetical protein
MELKIRAVGEGVAQKAVIFPLPATVSFLISDFLYSTKALLLLG